MTAKTGKSRRIGFSWGALLYGLLAAALLCMLAGCGSKDGEKTWTDTYSIEEESVPALPKEENLEMSSTDPDTYAYIGFEDAGGSVAKYVDSMTAEENGFAVVSQKYTATEKPDFTQEKGEVYLAKDAAKAEEKLVVLKLDWSPNICTVQVSIQDAPDQPVSSETQGLTHVDAATQIQSLSPSVLGLSGDSMEEYRVYIRNGLVMANNELCLWVEIYTTETAAGTNAPAGTYYLSRDGKRLYVLDRADNSVKALQMN